MDAFLVPPVVVDVGSAVCKAGRARQDRPTVLFPTLVGRPKFPRALVGGELDGDRFVGAISEKHRGALVLSHPVERGAVAQWDGFAAVMQHAFSEGQLGASMEDQAVTVMEGKAGGCLLAPPATPPPRTHAQLLMTEPVQTPPGDRHKMMAFLFETCRVPALHLASPPALALYGSGRTTGCVVDVGHGVSSVTPIYEGLCITHAQSRLNLGGQDVTHQLLRALQREGHVAAATSLASSAALETVRTMKETACYIAKSAAEEAAVWREGGKVGSGGGADGGGCDYTLPDGHRIRLGAERFRAGEVLFHPAGVVGEEEMGIGTAAAMAVLRCDVELRAALCTNMVLAGGTTAMRGFGERLLLETRKGVPADMKLKLWAPGERKVLAWIGGSILASLSTFRTMCWRKEEWDEYGPSMLTRKGMGAAGGSGAA